MKRSVVFRAVMTAALLGLAAVGVQLVAVSSLGELSPQPYGVSPDLFMAAMVEHPDTVLLFFAGDTLFPLSYLLVFAGLYLVTAPTSRLLAGIGLGGGLLTALLDVTENAFFISYTLLARHNAAPVEPDVLPVYVLTTLKWTAAFATLYTFALIFPRRTGLEWGIAGLMLAFLLFGLLSTALPDLIVLRGLFFLVGMPLFAWYFWLQSHTEAPDVDVTVSDL